MPRNQPLSNIIQDIQHTVHKLKIERLETQHNLEIEQLETINTQLEDEINASNICPNGYHCPPPHPKHHMRRRRI